MGSNPSDQLCNRDRCDYHRNFLNICVALVAITVYAVNTILWKPNSSSQFLHFYLNDLFAMPLILAYTNVLITWWGKRSWALTTPIRIGCLTVFCVIVWEGFAPMVLANSTRDLLDVVAYSSGSLCYFVVILAADWRNYKSRYYSTQQHNGHHGAVD